MCPGVVIPPVSPGVATSNGLTLGALELVALALGTLWTAVNVYQFYPVVQSAVERVADRARGRRPTSRTLPDSALPTVDVILPAYREAAVVGQAIRAVGAADYPPEKLDLHFVVEAGDAETRGALAELRDRHPDLAFEELAVPARYPGEPNKPRALNYAFEHTDGEVVGVVDAEDVVDPGLFREAATRLSTDCEFVQARLDMVNEDDGWLNVLFRAEYGFWYEVVMPAFERVGFPLPLSGTSCLFRRSLLVAADVERGARYGEGLPRDGRLWTGARRLFGWTPWDPANVTEDFELGLFLWERGFDVGYLDSVTAEESPRSLDDWIKQRTRWKKGKLQTLRKHLAVPPEGWRARVHLLWQSALPHVGPINVAGVALLVAVANLARYRPRTLVWAVLSLGLAFVVVSTALFAYGYWRASDVPATVKARRVATVALTLPVYWLLQWVADLRAIRQTYGGRLDWERVRHHGRAATDDGGPSTDVDPSSGTDAGPSRVLDPVRRRVALVGVLAVAATVRFYDFAGPSLWQDEVYTIAGRGAASLPDLLVASGDPHPPLYFLVLHYWMAAFGQTAAGARSLSVVLSLATVAGVYLLGTELFDDRVGLLAAALVALSSFHVHHGRTARMYALFGLLAVGSWLAFCRLRTADRAALAGYVLATAAMLYTHAFAVFVLAAQHLFVALSETRAGVPLRRWARAQAGVGVLGAPVIAFLAWRTLGPLVAPGTGAHLSWLPLPSTVAVTATVLGYVGYPAHYPIAGGTPVTWTAAGAVASVAVGASILAVVTYRRSGGYRLTASGAVGQMAALASVPIVVPFVVSFLVAPMYAPRYTLPASFGLALLAAAGAVNAPGPRVRRALVAVLLVGSGALLGAYFAADSVEDWRAATDPIEREARPGDLLVLQPGWIEPSVDYYYGGPDLERVRLEDGTPSEAELGRLERRGRSADRVWLVAYGGAPAVDGRPLLDGGDRTEVYDGGVITVVRYDRRE